MDDYRSMLPENLYSAAQTRLLDHFAIESLGIPGLVLMERAGQACFQQIMAYWPGLSRIHIFCGSGNNAGDGYVIASQAQLAGLEVCVFQLGKSSKLGEDAAVCRKRAISLGVRLESVQSNDELALLKGDSLGKADLFVDALLGTGVRGEVKGLYAKLITLMNAAPTPVFSVDTPSGLCVDTGTVLGVAVVADLTLTFIALKKGLLTGQGPAMAGRLLFDNLQLPASIYQQIDAQAYRAGLLEISPVLPVRKRTSHKGHYGHVLILGGDTGMAGAALMAGIAAARTGAGLISIGTRPENCAAVTAHQPELMCRGINHRDDLMALLDKASVVVLGPGLGQSAWSQMLLLETVNSGKPAVIDADGLNLVSSMPALSLHSLCVLTPHSKEASRLLNCSTEEVECDRFAAVQAIVKKYKACVVLKGAGSLICDENKVLVASVGGPAMASGGMGDVLSGVVGALLAQGLTPYAAARSGVILHGHAADTLAESEGECGLLATDLIPLIRQLLNKSVMVNFSSDNGVSA